jgi:hypothetical protein
MIIISDACTINITNEVNYASRIIIDNSRLMLQIVSSLSNNSRGAIDDRKMFIVLATKIDLSIQIKLLVQNHGSHEMPCQAYQADTKAGFGRKDNVKNLKNIYLVTLTIKNSDNFFKIS